MTDPIPELIKSSILVDPKMVGELQHRWNCYQVMLDVLYEIEFSGPNDANPICPSCYGWQRHEKDCKLAQAIAKAERKE